MSSLNISTLNFKEILESKKDIVWAEIDSYLKKMTEVPAYCQLPPKYQKIKTFHYDMVCEYPNRKGKYIRPSLVLMTAAAMGIDEQLALKTAAAMQVSEEWILDHDDIEDDSLERRGKPALHRIYGKELAINAGDALHVLMWKILADNYQVLDPITAQKVFDEFYCFSNRTILGQTMEIKYIQDNNLDIDYQDILTIIEGKTCFYSISGPMRLGAIIAGATPNQLDVLYQLGLRLGWAFQIKDDLLDLTSDFAGQKKQQGNDIYEGKRTIMLVHLLKNCSEVDKKELIRVLSLNRDQKTPAEVEWVISKMRQYGSLDYALSLANKFTQEAHEIFDTQVSFLSCEPYRSQLKMGIDFLLNRDH